MFRKIHKKSTMFIMMAVLCMTITIPLSSHAQAQSVKKQKVKNIILFIGDGMNIEHEIATSQYLYGENYNMVWHHMDYQAPVSTWDVTTYNKYALANGGSVYDPANFNPLFGYDPTLGGRRPFPLDDSGLDEYFLQMIGATDSASAGTAIACGYKTDDGNIAWLPGDPASGALKTIAERMREESGTAIGVVSTVPFTHATPATFASHNVSRNNYAQIADEMIRMVQPDVVIGGGFPYGGKFSYLSQTLYNDVKSGAVSDYIFVERAAGVDGGNAILAGAAEAVATGKYLFGLFGGSGGNFESPVPSDTPSAPSIARATIENPLLKDATIAALNVLSQDPDGFFVMIEQGDIDWANHANDFARMIGCTWDLDEAIKATIEFVNKPDDSIDWSNTMLMVTADHSNSYTRLARNEDGKPVLGLGDLPYQVPNSAPVGSYKPGFIYPDGDVSYSSGGHTNELVMLYTTGKGINFLAKRQGDWYPGTQILDNTQMYDAIAEAVSIK
jgi:alkaline phosphatase